MHATPICLAYGTSGHLSVMTLHGDRMQHRGIQTWLLQLAVTQLFQQSVQNNLAYVVCSCSRLTPPEPLLRNLHWLPVRQRIDYKLANFCYLAVSRHQPVYLAHLISSYNQSRLLRSSTQSLLSVPPHNIDIAACRFSDAAPRLWNSLPLSCRTAPSINVFKIRTKTFLFSLR